MQRWSTAAASIALWAAVGLVYGPSVGFEFVTWDDPANIFENPLFNPLNGEQFARIWTKPYFGLFAPVSYTVWAAVAVVGRTVTGQAFDPRVYHLLNVLLHAGVVCLVLTILRRLGATTAAALAGALLFCLHPVQAETAAWVTEARGLLAAFFSCLTIWLYLRSQGAEVVRDSIDGALRPRQTAVPLASGRWHLAASLTLALALMSKPSAVVIPVTLIGLEITLFGVGWRRAVVRVTDWLVLCVGWSVLSRLVQPATVLGEIVTPWKRPAVAADAVAFYVGKMVCPVNLCAEYGRRPSVVLTQSGADWLLAALLLAVAAGAVLALWRWSSPCAVLFLVPLVPVLGLTPFHYQELSTEADRYLYMAMLGPALGLAWWLTRRPSHAAWLLTAAALAACGWTCQRRVYDWRDSVALWDRVLSINPHSSAAHVNLAVVRLRQQRLDDAEDHFQRAALLKPSLAQAHLGLGDVALQRSQPESARDHYVRAVECDPRSIRAQSSLANSLLSLGDRSAAIAAYRRALEIDVRQPSAANFLARLLAVQEKGRYGAGIEATKWAEWACQQSGYADHLALDTLAAAHAQAAHYDEALRWLDRAEAVAQARGDKSFAPRAARRRALYERRQPLREKELYLE